MSHGGLLKAGSLVLIQTQALAYKKGSILVTNRDSSFAMHDPF